MLTVVKILMDKSLNIIDRHNVYYLVTRESKTNNFFLKITRLEFITSDKYLPIIPILLCGFNAVDNLLRTDCNSLHIT